MKQCKNCRRLAITGWMHGFLFGCVLGALIVFVFGGYAV